MNTYKKLITSFAFSYPKALKLLFYIHDPFQGLLEFCPMAN